MLSTRDKVWNRNFRKLKAYIDEHHHLPDKKKVEHRGLLNWVKYNRKKIKAGTLAPEKERLFSDLLASRHAELDSASRSRHAGLRPGISTCPCPTPFILRIIPFRRRNHSDAEIV